MEHLPREINHTVNDADADLIVDIVQRACDEKIVYWYDKLSVMLYLTACHANGCPLNLKGMLTVDKGTLAHDISGIIAHLDKRTGKLKGFFLPRCAINH